MQGAQGQPAQEQPTQNFFSLSQDQLAELIAHFASQHGEGRPSNGSVRIKEPQTFDGKMNHVRDFILECELYIQAKKEKFASDEQKILFVLSYCAEGSAKNFREHVIHTATTAPLAPEGAQVPGYGLWTAFKNHFSQAFITSDVKGEAIRDLQRLKQTGGVDAYIQQFKMLLARAEIHDYEASKQYFANGLAKYLLDKVAWQATLPPDIDGWYTMVQNLEKSHRYVQNLKGGHAGGAYHERHLPQGEPMDIDALRLSPNERTKRMQEGRCFECNGQGHIASQCPKKESKDGRKPSQGNKGYRQNEWKGSKKDQIKMLFKELGTDEKKQLLDELRGSNPAMRIRALLQEIPEEEKEEVHEQTVTENFA